MGDLEYIGRRVNQLGPKKNNCDRVCKRHYDLNLKRDKAQRLYHSKRERLPGINFIFDQFVSTKKQRTDPMSQNTTNQVPIVNEFSTQQTQTQTHWYPPSVTPSTSTLSPGVTAPDTTSTTTSSPPSTDTLFRTPPVYPYPQRQKGWPTWDSSRDGSTTIESPNEVGEELLLVDMVFNHMNKFLELFGQNSSEKYFLLESIKQNHQHQTVSVVIDELCTQTYHFLAQSRTDESKSND
jgi:hypothetical protein